MGRITGIDPSATRFNETEKGLDATDARFVDIIHTDGAPLSEGGVADPHPRGHADFYPNGGSHQPGCGFQVSAASAASAASSASGKASCNHSRAPAYFEESINTKIGFYSVQCDSYEEYLNGTCAANDVQLMGDLTPSR